VISWVTERSVERVHASYAKALTAEDFKQASFAHCNANCRAFSVKNPMAGLANGNRDVHGGSHIGRVRASIR